jgi:hypothetical protein
MTDETAANTANTGQSKKDEPISLSEFLGTVAPSSWRNVPDLWEQKWSSGSKYSVLKEPDIIIHCDDKICGGSRTFRSIAAELVFYNDVTEQDFFLSYICSNCHNKSKRFAVRAVRTANGAGGIYKYGEEPAFGPPTPPRLIRLFEGEHDLFFKGRRCETQGLGIGAFVYYRRVVENHKKQIFEQIIKVAEQVGIDRQKIDALKSAKEEIQFSKAVEAVKDAIPPTLLIKGQNPLTLLHGALSAHLHEKSDKECLALAQSVRVVLVELAERIGAALKDDADLAEAVKQLMKGRS